MEKRENQQCRCSCAIGHVKFNVQKCHNVHRQEIKEENPKIAPWLRILETPITQKEKKKKRGNMMAPRKKTALQNAQKKSPKKPTTGSHPIPIHSNKLPRKPKYSIIPRSPNPLSPKRHPQLPRNPLPRPVGLWSLVRAEGTWPNMADHYKASRHSCNTFGHGKPAQS